MDENYQLKEKWSIPTLAKRPIEAIVDDMLNQIREIRKQYAFSGIGIGSPGDIDSVNGICCNAGNIPYQNTPLAAIVSEATQLPVYLANDATAALYGELYAGSGKQYQNVIMLTLGTGVGGGIAINGVPYLGSKGLAGELGHLCIKYDGLPCTCGLTGCYEQYASVNALIDQTNEAIRKHPDSLLALQNKDGATGRSAFDAGKQGCPVAAAVIEQYAEYIACGINSLEYIFQPDAIIIGGAISSEEENLLGPIRRKLFRTKNLFTSALKNDAGLIGAAVVAGRMLQQS